MKRYYQYIAILAAAALALAGCTKNEWVSGSIIRFGAETQAEPLTKSSYGTISSGKQMINWEEGDILRIVCAQASATEGAGTSADYRTTSDITASGIESHAKLELAGSAGLRWGSTSAEHKFYAVYPSPSVKTGDALTAEGGLTGQIPADQTGTITGSYSSGWTASPDMTNQYMVARKTVAAGTQETPEVFLKFTPITTAIEFEVTNAMDDDLTVASIEIISEAKNLSGKFTSSLTELNENGGTIPAVSATAGTTGSSVKVSFRTSDGTAAKPVMAKDCKLTFTAFFLPEADLDDLTFRINKLDGTWIQTKLARSATENITFARGKKHFVKGLLAQEGVKWTMDFTSQVVSWQNGTTSDSEVFDQNNYTFEVNGTSDWSSLLYNNTTATLAKTLTVKSYSNPKEADTPKEAVAFDASYSTDGGLTWNSFDAASAGAALNGLYGFAGTDNTGSVDGLDYTLTAAERTASQPGSNEYWVGGHGDWSPEDWTDPDDPICLNKYNFITDDRNVFKQNTANCYIIRHPGRYCIPMVYGNGQLNTGNNKKAYWFGNQGSGALGNCLNYKGDQITNPIIAEDLGIVTDYGTDGSKKSLVEQVGETLNAFSAEVLWCDAGADVIEIFGIIMTPDFAWNGYYHATHGICFDVDYNTVCQCNAVIVLKDENGAPVWSWHIWITNNPAVGNPAYETLMDNGRVVDYFPMPAIGYKDGTVYFGRPKTLLKLRQQRSGKEILFTVNQTDVRAESSVMYYQHGRKDPFMSSAEFKTLPPISGKAIVDALWCPGVLATGWNGGGYSNLWSGAYSTLGSLVYVQDAMRKTIYDPSPLGYIVPVQRAFAPFSVGSRLGGYANGCYYKLSDEDKEGIFFGAYGYKTSGTDVTGYGTTGMFWTSIPESSSNGGTFQFNASSVSLPVNIPLSAACPVRPVTDPNYAQ